MRRQDTLMFKDGRMQSVPPEPVSRPSVRNFVAGLPLGWVAAGLIAYGVAKGRGQRQ